MEIMKICSAYFRKKYDKHPWGSLFGKSSEYLLKMNWSKDGYKGFSKQPISEDVELVAYDSATKLAAHRVEFSFRYFLITFEQILRNICL